MCNEPQGLSGWPRKAARWAMLAAAVTLALAAMVATRGPAVRGAAPLDATRNVPPKPAADEPVAPTFSMEKAAANLDAVALDWTRQQHCGSCHSNYPYLVARPACKSGTSSAQDEIRIYFDQRVVHWDDTAKEAKPKWDAEVVSTASTLAQNDAATTGRLQPVTRTALDRMWTLQKPDGSWNWLKCGWAPSEHDDYYGAVYAAIGVGAAPDGYAGSASAREGVRRLRSYLTTHEPPDLHHRTFLLWASTRLDGLMDGPPRARTIEALRKVQRADGGWSLPSLGSWKRRDGEPNSPDAPSDGYATGLVVYVLRQAGVAADDPALARGVAWLESHQRISGGWFTRSLNDDKDHYIAHAGTAYAVLAIAACQRP
jgi:squalene-hopene/tetraprenyl-beta-curcumene cyclase